MKANKALKRLAKIEALISDVAKRYSSGKTHVRDALQDAKAALARVKAAVSSRAPVKTAKKSPPIKKAAKKRVAKKVAPARKKTAAKKSAPVTRAPKKRAAKKRVSKKTAPVPEQTVPIVEQTAPAPEQTATEPTAVVL